MQFKHRPIGVTLLSLAAFAASPALIFLAVKSFVLISANIDLPLKEVEPVRRLVLIAFLGLLYLSLLFLAWLSFVAGRDLWHLDARGRALAITTMALLTLLLAGILSVSMIETRNVDGQVMVAAAIFSCCVLGILYLCLPGVRAKFQVNPKSSGK